VTFNRAREVPPPSVDMVPDIPPTISNVYQEPSPPAIPVTQPVSSPIHPFTNIVKASYAPPSMRNVGALPEKMKSTDKGEKDVAYKTVAPSQNEKLAETVYRRTMQIPFVTLTTEELFALSPDYRQRVREAVTPKRVVPGEDKPKVVAKYMLGDPQLLFSVNTSERQAATSDNEKGQQNEAFVQPGERHVIAKDPFEQFLNLIGTDDHPDRITVAKESHALRSLSILIDHKENIECVVDPGLQIIAMSEAVSHNLEISYDPSIQLNMESTNGGIDRSLGLARNIPCHFGDITLYLQIHVIWEPAYDILIGRPFDVLTTSVVKNFANEDQTITISNPNSGRIATIPTFPRGKAKHRKKTEPLAAHFHALSRN
jgi:hypothetical protein